MAAKWTWYRQQVPFNLAADGEGWFSSTGWVISAPESLQRVIVRADATANEGGLTQVLGKPIAGGLVRLQVSVTEGVESRVYYAASRGVQVDVSRFFAGDLGSYFVEAHAWIDHFDVDMDLKRAAPPPPADGLILGVYMNWSPLPEQNPAEWTYLTPWVGDIDVLYLTSQPSA